MTNLYDLGIIINDKTETVQSHHTIKYLFATEIIYPEVRQFSNMEFENAIKYRLELFISVQ